MLVGVVGVYIFLFWGEGYKSIYYVFFVFGFLFLYYVYVLREDIF